MDPASPQHNLTEESALVERARQGDRPAFDRLAVSYRRVLFALAHRHAGEADPDDVVQEILLRAWEKLPGLRDPRAFPAWLTILAVNLCRRRGAQAARRPASLDEDAWASILPDPLDAVLRRESSEEVRRALLAIPEGNRRALILHLWGQYSHAEIAARLGTSVTTVEGRIYRAKAQLRRRLEFLQPAAGRTPRGETAMAKRGRRATSGDQPEIVPQIGHSTGVYGIAVSPDGKHLVTAAGGVMVLWNLETGRQEARVVGLPEVHGPVFSPDGRWLAASDALRRTLIVDVALGKVARVLEARAWLLAFSADSTTLYTVSWLPSPEDQVRGYSTVSAFTVATGKLQDRVEGLPGYGATMGHDGSRLVTMVAPPPGEDGLPPSDAGPRFHVWDLPQGKRLSVLDGLPGYPHGRAKAISQDGNLVAVASCFAGPSRAILVWEAETGRLCHTLSDFPQDDPVYALAFHPCEPCLVSTHQNWETRVWSLSTGECTRELERTVRCDDVAFFPDGRRLAGSGGGGAIWEWESGRITRRLGCGRPNPQAVAFSPDGKQLATGFYFGSTLWDLTKGTLFRRLESSRNVLRRLVHFSPDGRRLLAAGGQVENRTGTWYDMLQPPSDAFVWDTETGERQQPLADPPGILHGLAISPDGARAAAVLLQPERAAIATGTFGLGHTPRWGGALLLWCTDTWQVERQIPYSTCPLDGDVVAFSPDGTRVAAAGWTQNDAGYAAAADVTLWDVVSGEPYRRWELAGSQIEGIAFSPDGGRVAAGLHTGVGRTADLLVAHVWEVGGNAEGTPYHFVGAQGWASCVVFSRDGTLLAAGSSDGYLVLWDAASARVVRGVYANPGGVNGLSFSADGALLATAGADGATHVWRVSELLASGPVRPSATLVLAGGDRWLAYTPDGFYECPPDAEELLLWRVGKELCGPERMRERCHHPERVAAALRGRPPRP